MALSSLSATVSAIVNLTVGEAADFANPSRAIAYPKTQSLSFGTGADQANYYFVDTRILVGSANETLDLTALTNNSGSPGLSCVFTKLKVFYIEVVSTNSDSQITVGNSGANAFNDFFSDQDAYSVDIRQGGFMLCVAGDATAYTVDATHKDLKILNLSASSLTYNIILIGVG